MSKMQVSTFFHRNPKDLDRKVLYDKHQLNLIPNESFMIRKSKKIHFNIKIPCTYNDALSTTAAGQFWWA